MDSDNLKNAARSGRPKTMNNKDKKNILKDIIRRGNKKIQRKSWQRSFAQNHPKSLHELGFFLELLK